MWGEARKKYPIRRLSIRYMPPEGILIGHDLFGVNFNKGKNVSFEG